ncbi:EpsG family protein [Candidatus Cetobacterium colombiensis]|uniref:EpsG family protein n=1 Tax=Candidatus Cetobacterium colombiensis TaxID=3073100 RepID=A0ABU4WD14_9FUSO|nr:EpsG family protein [Candidatus Cetobacterium colombiensis]MDX8337055.1 EpsG family protein [Candidatus Cetobacterium colombiensis]
MIFIFIAFILLLLGIYDVFGDNKELKEKILKMIVLFLIFFLGTRGFLGWDWYFYYPSFMEGTYVYEKGYMLYTQLIRSIFKNYIFYQILTTTIDFIALYYIFKKYCKYPILAFAIFFSIQGLHIEVELLRNIKAIILFLFSLRYIEEKKIIPFLLLNLIGIYFHTSAIIFLPMYFILNYKYKDKVILGLFLLGSIYYLLDLKIFLSVFNLNLYFLPKILNDKILSYNQVIPKDLIRGFNSFYIERLVIFILAYKYENNLILKNSAYIWIGIFLFTSELSIVSLRIGILFVYSSWLILTRGIEKVHRKDILLIIIFILCLGRIYKSLTFPGNIINYKYENIFFNKLDYERREKELIEGKKFLKDSHGKELLIQY